MTLLAEVATYLGDAARAARLYELLLPYDGLNVIAGRAAASYGPVARVLALLAATEGRLDDAERHFADALALSDRMGDRPFAARTRYELARMLLDRGRGGDRERGLELLATALDSAQEIGMVRLVQEALAARLDAQGLAALDVSTSIDFLIDEVAAERPDIAAHAAPDGQVTILFSDIEDSTLMTERLGDERWLSGPARPQRALPPARTRPRRATRSKTRATASCSSSPTPAERSSARRRSSASSPTASRSRASGCGCGWGCTQARRSARRATSSAAA